MRDQERQEMIDSIENTIALLHTRIFRASQKGIQVNLEIVMMPTLHDKQVPFISANFEKESVLSVAQIVIEKYKDFDEMVTKAAALAITIEYDGTMTIYIFGDGSKIVVVREGGEVAARAIKGEL